MKYILLLNGKKSDFGEYVRWSKQDFQSNVEYMRAFGRELKESGVLVAFERLGWPNEARLVRAGGNGEPVTDGVFPESKEFLGGYWIVDVESPEQACMLAARLSQAPVAGGKPGNMPVEVRQVLSTHSDLGL